ncbi:cystathionine gamma-synthase [Histoplasma capsulatum var. duboisii H88]|uniref:Cystathionine gamma-synthase n=1 Tax=Ajellomyces capsulatus (strain H88) TaxID=544711 RepID=A0A8A1LVD0_AJEC8|nr:cystathionine gamma-synthase [Histoplasma capsulatum var. duboisii H88]
MFLILTPSLFYSVLFYSTASRKDSIAPINPTTLPSNLYFFYDPARQPPRNLPYLLPPHKPKQHPLRNNPQVPPQRARGLLQLGPRRPPRRPRIPQPTPHRRRRRLPRLPWRHRRAHPAKRPAEARPRLPGRRPAAR